MHQSHYAVAILVRDGEEFHKNDNISLLKHLGRSHLGFTIIMRKAQENAMALESDIIIILLL